MTTEDDFQAVLDADPSDWQTRLVFADWLQEHAACFLCKGRGEHRTGYVKCDVRGVHDSRRVSKCMGCNGTGICPDPRAEGYRALGTLRVYPRWWNGSGCWGYLVTNNYWSGDSSVLWPSHWLPLLWLEAIEGAIIKHSGCDRLVIWEGGREYRYRAEDATARAFLKLIPEERAAVLAGKL